jgi:nicotinamidase/pyrazinamidase
MDTWGAELHPNLLVDGPRVRKGSAGEDGYSGFSTRDPGTGRESPTELDGLLRGAGIERVVIAGLATDYCVKATALDAIRLGYPTRILADGIRPVDLAPGDGVRALAEMAAAGVEVVGQPVASQ